MSLQPECVSFGTTLKKRKERRRLAGDCQKRGRVVAVFRGEAAARRASSVGEYRGQTLTLPMLLPIEWVSPRGGGTRCAVAHRRDTTWGERGGGPMFKRKVGELARRPGLIAIDATVTAAAAAMACQDVDCLAVVSGRKVVGFVTEPDLCPQLDVDLEESAPVAEVLTRAVGLVSSALGVDDAVRAMLEQHRRHLIVQTPTGAMCGIVTDKELVTALAVDFMVENVLCQNLVRPDTAVVAPETSVRDTLRLLRARDADSVVAVRTQMPVGIFTERDAISKVLGFPDRLTAPLSRVMTSPVISVPGTAMLYKVILYMHQKEVRRVVVVHGDGTLAGLLTQHHILAYARRLL